MFSKLPSTVLVLSMTTIHACCAWMFIIAGGIN